MDYRTLMRTPHPSIRRWEFGRIGVLLTNLGTPDATHPTSIRRHLAEFLKDRRVIAVVSFALVSDTLRDRAEYETEKNWKSL